jgi:hypothetical protein
MGAVILIIGLLFLGGIGWVGYLIFTKLTVPAIRGVVRAGKKGVVIDPASRPQTTGDRIAELDKMLATQRITQDEYAAARAKALGL